mgnify:CR=1 FL=1
MSSHDCRIEGNIQLKDGVTRAQVEASLSAFLEEHQSNLTAMETEGEFDFREDNGDLYLSIPFHGLGGYHDDSVERLAKNLAELSEDGEFFEMFDDDTGDDEARCTPYFLAAPEKGQLEYGIQAMSDWIRPLIGDERFDAISNEIRKAGEDFRNTQGASHERI